MELGEARAETEIGKIEIGLGAEARGAPCEVRFAAHRARRARDRAPEQWQKPVGLQRALGEGEPFEHERGPAFGALEIVLALDMGNGLGDGARALDLAIEREDKATALEIDLALKRKRREARRARNVGHLAMNEPERAFLERVALARHLARQVEPRQRQGGRGRGERAAFRLERGAPTRWFSHHADGERGQHARHDIALRVLQRDLRRGHERIDGERAVFARQQRAIRRQRTKAQIRALRGKRRERETDIAQLRARVGEDGELAAALLEASVERERAMVEHERLAERAVEHGVERGAAFPTVAVHRFLEHERGVAETEIERARRRSRPRPAGLRAPEPRTAHGLRAPPVGESDSVMSP